jgi:hypothetical protein
MKRPTRQTTTGLELVAKERLRQITGEMWGPSHDDKHTRSELAKAANSYVAAVTQPDEFHLSVGAKQAPCDDWPWAKKWWKPSEDPVRNLVKAAALLVAEIDRRERIRYGWMMDVFMWLCASQRPKGKRQRKNLLEMARTLSEGEQYLEGLTAKEAVEEEISRSQ